MVGCARKTACHYHSRDLSAAPPLAVVLRRPTRRRDGTLQHPFCTASPHSQEYHQCIVIISSIYHVLQRSNTTTQPLLWHVRKRRHCKVFTNSEQRRYTTTAELPPEKYTTSTFATAPQYHQQQMYNITSISIFIQRRVFISIYIYKRQ